MFYQKFYLKLLITLFLISLNPIKAENLSDEELLKNYVRKIIQEGEKLLSSKMIEKKIKQEKTRALLEKNLYLEWMSNYVLGRNKKIIEPEQVEKFKKIHAKFIIKAFSDLFKHYNGQKVEFEKVIVLSEDMFIVNTKILRTNGMPSLKVDYLVFQMEDLPGKPFRVGDIITEGISILNSQKSEFNSVIKNHGINALINNLQRKITKSEI